MTPEQFAYWLQGFAELNAAPPTVRQWEMIKEHIGLVFKKVTPPMDFNKQPLPYKLIPNYPNYDKWTPWSEKLPEVTCRGPIAIC